VAHALEPMLSISCIYKLSLTRNSRKKCQNVEIISNYYPEPKVYIQEFT
jgi:hypothetical protein